MGDKTGISWTDATWNPVRGCSRVSEGCRNCYAERVAARFSGPGQPYHGFAKVVAPRDILDRVGGRRNGWTRKVALVAEHLADPLRWKKSRRVFVNSMSDLFHEGLTNEQIAAVFGVMAAAPRHTFQVLTKRARRMREWFAWVGDRGAHGARSACRVSASLYLDAPPESSIPPARGFAWPLPNVWLGVSVEDQAAANERIPELLATPAAVRFLSCEPLIGPLVLDASDVLAREAPGTVSLGDWLRPLRLGGYRDDAVVDWVIAGCESGPGARPCSVEWLRALRDQCAEAGVPFFLKQATEEVSTRAIYPSRHAARVETPVIALGDGSTRKAGGVIELPYLDGVQHAAFPTTKEAARDD